MLPGLLNSSLTSFLIILIIALLVHTIKMGFHIPIAIKSDINN